MRVVPLALALALGGCGLGNALVGFPPGGAATEICIDEVEEFINVGFDQNFASVDSDTGGDCLANLPDGGCGSDGPSSVSYRLFRVDAIGSGELLLFAEFDPGFDGYLAVYESGRFDPSDPTDGCVQANDDAGDISISSVSLQVFDFASFDVVVAGLNGGDGGFDLNVDFLQ